MAATTHRIIENTCFHEGLLVEGVDGLTIRDCTLSNRQGDHGLRLINCRNVRVERCRIAGVGNESSLALAGEPGYAPFALTEAPRSPVEAWRDGTLSIPPDHYAGYIFTPLRGYGIHLVNCHHVTVIDNEVIDVFGQGVVAFGESRAHAGDITIEANRIAYIYDDAIKFHVRGDQGDLDPSRLAPPFLGGVVRGNQIHDIGLGVTRLQAPRHGMYLKAADILVEDNTIYNCFFGTGISLRNAGIIRSNRVWNCAIGCIVYQTQTVTTGTSRVVLIENNDCRQDYAMDFPNRHIFNPTKAPESYVNGTFLLGVNCYYEGMNPITDRHSSMFVQDFILRNNRSFLYRDYPERIGERPLPHLKINGLGPDHRLDISGNTFIDERPTACFCDPASVEPGNICTVAPEHPPAAPSEEAVWRLAFEENGETPWEQAWFADGRHAQVENRPAGLHFAAGPDRSDHAHHAVLWTRKTFSGDLRVEYDFTRTDTTDRDVVILYLHAEGLDAYPFSKDIEEWSELRTTPHMHLYWWHMNALHISYAVDDAGENSYIRVRRYPVSPGRVSWEQTVVEPEKNFSSPGFFRPGETCHVTVEKIGSSLTMELRGAQGARRIFDWNLSRFPSISSGRIGLRHMFGRSALYQNLRIYERNEPA